VTANLLYGQNTLKFDSVINFITEKGIKLNAVTPPAGFTVHYNCDSLLFMKGIFGDTIKIWTSIMDWYQDVEEFKEILKNESFGVTQFVKSIDNDGRIYVSSYHQTEFIFRKDSLFEIGNSNPTPSEPLTKLFSDFFSQKIDEETYEIRLDSLNQIKEKQAVYTPKLIFAKRMFQKSKKIKLSKKLNFQGDTIELERQWVENGKTCYLVRINNKEDGQETSYAYAINQDMKFVFWEGCVGH
jgi:hypothetical protein